MPADKNKLVARFSLLLAIISSFLVDKDEFQYLLGFPFKWLVANYRTNIFWLEFYKYMKIDLGLLFINVLFYYLILKLILKLKGSINKRGR